MKGCPSCSAAVLAGGKGSRMGGTDKAALSDHNGAPLLDSTVQQLLRFFPSVRLIRRKGLYEQTILPAGIQVTYDLFEAEGPLTGVCTALSDAGTDYVFVVPCDAAPLPESFLRHMIQQLILQPEDAVLACSGGFVQPFFGFYKTSLCSDMKTAVSAGIQSPWRFIQNYSIHVTAWNPSAAEDKIITFNSPDELCRYNQRKAGHIKETG